ncbi:MAG: NADH-quinone oxidoreductase subunit NuoN [Rhodospirillales bacterium]|nr:MAG: NADH-quinone oxidoreductase subunit NuoN [Rhodospirillales bacterium]
MTDLPIWVPAVPEMFVAVAGMALLLIGAFSRSDVAERIVTNLTLAAMLVALGFVLSVGGGTATAFGGMFVTDVFAIFMKVLVVLGALLAVLMSREFLAHEGIGRFEYPVLILFATLGMMVMISANNLMSVYLGLELQSLCLYVIAAFHRDSLRSSEAGLKYFVLGALSSGMLLYGISIVYGYTGNTGFAGLAESLAANGPAEIGLIVGLVFVIAGLAFKISAVPFHMWTPDVYEGAPTPVTAFFSVAPKIAAFALILRVMLDPFGPLIDEWRQVIVAIAIASMALGAYAAIAQTNIKRLMAYSSIGHVGYALMGLAAGTADGVRGVLIYFAIYLVMNIGAFACILSMRRHGDPVEGIDDLAGLSASNPRMALVLTAFMFSLAGIPWFAGFFGKLYVFMAAIDAGLYVLAIFGVLASVVAAYYYLRIVKIMYFDAAVEPLDRPTSRTLGFVMVVAALLVTTFIVYPAPLVNRAGEAARSLLAG